MDLRDGFLFRADLAYFDEGSEGMGVIGIGRHALGAEHEQEIFVRPCLAVMSEQDQDGEKDEPAANGLPHDNSRRKRKGP